MGRSRPRYPAEYQRQMVDDVRGFLAGSEAGGLPVRQPDLTLATMDHSTPTDPAIDAGLRTADLVPEGQPTPSTTEMGEALAARIGVP